MTELNFLSANFAWDTTVPAGTLELIKATGETVECSLILMSDLPVKLPAHLAPEWIYIKPNTPHW